MSEELFEEEQRESEVYVEMAQAIERAVGKPGWAIGAVFGAAAIGRPDPETGETTLALSTASWPPDEQLLGELRRLLRMWLDAAEAEEA